jgi:hypothetical protein
MFFLTRAQILSDSLFCQQACVLVRLSLMKHGMRLGDFLDLEWFLEQDRLARTPWKCHAARPQNRACPPRRHSVPAEQHGMFWLERRREAAEAGATPSRPPCELVPDRVAPAFWDWQAGLATGVSLAREPCSLYSGIEPVNVSVFLLLAVFPQAGLCHARSRVSSRPGPVRRGGSSTYPLRPLFRSAVEQAGQPVSGHRPVLCAPFCCAGMAGRRACWPGSACASCIWAGFCLARGLPGGPLLVGVDGHGSGLRLAVDSAGRGPGHACPGRPCSRCPGRGCPRSGV